MLTNNRRTTNDSCPLRTSASSAVDFSTAISLLRLNSVCKRPSYGTAERTVYYHGQSFQVAASVRTLDTKLLFPSIRVHFRPALFFSLTTYY